MDSLSYFSSKSIEPGSLVKINLRGKNVFALVVKSREATDAKAEIKSAGFQMRKISGEIAKPFLPGEFLRAAEKTAEFFAVSVGSVISHLIPQIVLENPNLLCNKQNKEETKNNEAKSEVSVLQAPNEERLAHYKLLIREEFAKKKSVFLCLPRNEDIRRIAKILERGIESFVFPFHDGLSKKELRENWKGIFSSSHPVLIIGTARWLFLLRDDLGSVIVDEENGNGWKTISRPFIDLRFFAEALAAQKNIRIIFGDSILRVETLHRYKQGDISEFESVKWRLPKEQEIKIVDMREFSKKEKEFKALSGELLNLANKTVSAGSNMFIFAARKGLSPAIVCRDCGEQVKCFNCSSPMVLHKRSSGAESVFRCHQCGEVREAAELCQKCRSWKLMPLGSGIDRVAEEIRKNFPDTKIFEIHKDAVSSEKAFSVAENFYQSRGAILLGTEMAFPYLYKKICSVAIASFDSLFAIPDFRIREKIFRIILEARSTAREKLLIQSRNPEDKTLEFAVSGNMAEFYKSEIEDRKVLDYPPFGVFIKITVRGTRRFATEEGEKLRNILSSYGPAMFNSIHEKRGEQSAVNFVIKIKKEKWPDFSLLSALKTLPSHFEIKVDPDNLL